MIPRIWRSWGARCAAAALFFATLLLAVGCETTEVYRVSGLPFQSYSVDMTVTYLNEDALVERFGKKNNPFIPPETLLNFERFHVFEVTIRNDTVSQDVPQEVAGAIKIVRFLTQGFIFTSLDSDTLTRFWKIKLSNREGEQSVYRMKVAAEKNMLPDFFTVESGSEITGLVVFMGKIPQYGEGTVEVPLLSAEKEVLAIYKETFEF
jgi:hypothetical protein